jgi:hypothetical protein
MASNSDFDFIGFATSAIRTIDELRSTGKEGKRATESRINAFYRALGLPAVIIDDPNSTTPGAVKIDPTNAANSVKTTDVSVLLPGFTKEDFGARNTAFTKAATVDECVREMYFSSSRITDGLNVRARGKMLPLAVDGSVEILPKHKRVGLPFATDEELDVGNGKDKFKRPMIEAVISIRLKNIGAANNTYKTQVEADFTRAFPSLSAISLEDQNLLNVVIATSLRKCILASVAAFEEAIRKISLKVTKNGKVEITQEDAPVDQNQESAEPVAPAVVDQQEKSQLEKDKVKKSFMTMFEYEDATGSKKRSIRESLLSSELLAAVATSEGKVKRDSKEVVEKKDKDSREVKESLSVMNSFTGTFAGISGLDILIIITALFEVSLPCLFGLLNEDAKSALVLAKPDVEGQLQGALTVSDAIDTLSSKVMELYDFAGQAFISDAESAQQTEESNSAPQ